MTIDDMMRAHPVPSVREGIIECIKACSYCAEVCTICSDACLSEPSVGNLVECVTMNQNCATICQATATVLSRQSFLEPNITRKLVQAFLDACQTCALECERHGGQMEHCAVCAAACRRCEAACRNLLEQI